MRQIACAMVVALSGCNGCGSTGMRLDGGFGDGGGDGGACAVGEMRCMGVCVETASCALAITSVSPVGGFLDGGDWVTLGGAGFAAGMKVFIADGRAPVRVISATQALIQTPPGPLGAQDVKITVGGASAILHGGFTYRSAGLEMTWQQKPLMKVRGEDPAIAVMQDGRVLVAGGTTVPDSTADAVNTAEIYDRPTDTVTPVASTMSTVRWQNSAVTMLDGRVLVVGGACAIGPPFACNGNAQAADLFDPSTNAFSPTPNVLAIQRAYTRAVLMVDGRVFISSGNDPSVEIFDPATNAFTTIAHTTLHTYGFVVRLRDGRVLLGGGDDHDTTAAAPGVTAAELFDPDTNTFTPAAGPMTIGRSMLTAHTLPSGKVIIIAGASRSAGAITDPLASIELFDPATNTFAAAGYKLVTPRCWQASALVRDGTILVMGGYTVTGQCGSSVKSVEQIDPVAGAVKAFPDLPNTNTEWTAVTLLDGSVLGVGGGACGTSMALPDIDFLAGAPLM